MYHARHLGRPPLPPGEGWGEGALDFTSASAPRHTCPPPPSRTQNRPMRIHVSFIDRVGITQEVLALLGGRNLNLDAVEMVPPNVYIDAPTLSAEVLEELRDALFSVRGVQAVTVVDILPGQRRHLQIDAL